MLFFFAYLRLFRSQMMDCLYLWLMLVSLLLATGARAQDGAAVTELCGGMQTDCGSCISAHPNCSWCSDNQEFDTAAPLRCRTIAENSAVCSNIIYPQNERNATKNQDFSIVEDPTNTDVIQLKPQEVNLKLRIGEPTKVNVTFRKVIDYPLDLYYTMDLSYSMNNDLEMLKDLGIGIVDDIRANVTENVRLGFGTFVDKVVLPYATDDEETFRNLCPINCQPTFGFRHQLPITGNGTLFQSAVAATVISANLDLPEGGFDALMQIAACTDIIGWRQEALRVILLTSDAPSHSAMDGKLGGILEINDMGCHLSPDPDNTQAHIYTKSKEQDYPSVGQLREIFNRNKIQVILAVTAEVYDIYRELPRVLPSAYVGVLDGDSGNILTIISTTYNQIKSHFELINPPVSDNIKMTYRVLCPGSSVWVENSLECDNISIGNETTFQFEMTATSCPPDANHKDVIEIASNSIKDVVRLTVEYHCECGCAATSVSNTSHCNNQGHLQCGVCNCGSGRSGSHCQCETTSTTSQLEQNCKDPNGLNPILLCNGNGICDCDGCVKKCDSGYYGQYCQCRDTGCENVDGILCGGELQGNCTNCYEDRQCTCNTASGWSLSDAGTCICNDNKCKANPTDGDVCSGQGTCDCDKCRCNDVSIWRGQFCNDCIHPSCSERDATCNGLQLKECAECVYSLVTPTDCDAVCGNQGINYKTLSSLPNCSACVYSPTNGNCAACRDLNEALFQSIDCQSTRVGDECVTSYKIGWDETANDYIVFVKIRSPELDCPQPIDPLYIILPTVGGTLLIGIVILVICRLLKQKHDKKKFEEFKREVQQSTWTKSNNPIHKAAASRFMNPNYIGNDKEQVSSRTWSESAKPDLMSYLQK